MDYAIAALNRGFNVYLEKPVALNASEALQIAKALKQHPGQKLTVAHYRRALPRFLKVKQLLESNLVGDVRAVQIRIWQNKYPAQAIGNSWYLQPEISGGGFFHAMAPHQLDLMLFYFGEPEAYHGFSLNQSGIGIADDHVCGQILFKNKVVLNGSWCFNVGENQVADVIEIIGDKGKITFPFVGDYINWKTAVEEQTLNFMDPKYAQEPFIEKIVAYFNDEGPNPCSIDEAIVSMDVMDAFTGKHGRQRRDASRLRMV
jgi:predicted dehydrogenase